VTEAAETLPDDADTLKAMLLAERAESERLRQMIKELQRHRFGRRAETLPEEQLQLGLEEAEQVEAAGQVESEKTADDRKERVAPPPRQSWRLAGPSAADRNADRCGQHDLFRLRRSAAWDWRGCRRAARHGAGSVPGAGRAPTKIRLPGLRRCDRASRRAGTPDRGRRSNRGNRRPQVLVSKYADHLPLYRQAQIYARQGINLDRSTLADWVGHAAFLLRPVHERLLDKLKASSKLFADETTAPVLDPGRGRTKTGQLWAYARDDRSWSGADPPGVAYVYAPDRKAERPIPHLAGFRGILQVDGYGAYKVLAERGDLRLAFCRSHVRRRFTNWLRVVRHRLHRKH
jgi:hypothetical protein